MNYLLPTPLTGIDSLIQPAQIRLYDFVVTNQWGLQENQSTCMGRVYRNNVEDGYIPEGYCGGVCVDSNGTNTRGGLFQQLGKVVLFWSTIDSEKRQRNADYVSRCELICFADMSIVRPSNMRRNDEQMANDLELFFLSNGCGWVVTDITRDIDEVLKRFSGAQKRSALTRNMSGNGGGGFAAIKLTVENYNNIFN